MESSSIAEWLRSLPSLTGSPPPFDLSALPDDPEQLFTAWLREAVDSGVPEPHAATLATVDADGLPDARTLILKDVDDHGWAVAGPRSSVKGTQLAAHPAAALNFWWQPLVRAVRVRGNVREATGAEVAADLAARSAEARAGVAADDWMLWRIAPQRVEFWQGSLDRNHTRVVYERDGEAWRRTRSGGGSSSGREEGMPS
ncbi:pyridoxamine 5'-phosphate oxidase family protein [Microbacterium sp. zg.Y1090]|uniref:pyridoxine/pyridoxamine 5'-phosphate oxidase n=1 Tax=Microbacterium TaxID=33882 RepID=UPI00214B647F|nr:MULTISPECIES: pyridoxamine 5'-phosphate oxidase family protein [unclassified Microbacterium]MCR2812930.1 pyridoxamine 5'-phosphate oxidase family protein [Microbacterium sp. zg.Y1084]MCR2817261.1 pyridoxamine 5'-phosphate oxidase family protein [Microbacterium sp. zg.Y1090]MDL5486071.1 pyridoxamine 5'-phosphate oxidase family protein [Microbacterium sp. zg-Y1211]WIM29250.1 pyridoxamine 5'-phosphate oxidase family protein [Microbacterium sp. zg-Y1090]